MADKGKYKWMKWYPGAMRAETAYLQCSLETRLVWRELLDYLYDQEPRGYLYNGGEAISAAGLGMAIAVPEKIVTTALSELLRRGVCSETGEGHELGPGIIFSRRMVRDSSKSTEFTEYGHRGGNPTLLKAGGKAPSPKAATGPGSPKIADLGDGAGRFDQFWAAYPRKVGKGEVKKWWLKHRPGEELTATIIAAVEAQKTGDAWTKDGGKYIPYPTTWLNREGWEDEVRPSRAPSIPDGLRANPEQELPI